MQIVYSDARIVVAVKPAGVLSTDGGMPALLRRQLGTECFRTVHRLDAPVAGLMVLARSAQAASILSRQIREGRFGKTYLAVVHGTPPPDGTWRDLLGRDRTRRLTYVAPAPGKGVQEAILHYKVLKSCKGLSLVSIELETGRTHQIRVQFASRGYPLSGDRRYGMEEDNPFPIALWSYRLSFAHPESGEALTFHLPPPVSGAWKLFSAQLEALT